MSTEPAKPTPFNPGWLTPALVILTGVISGSVNTALNARDVSELRSRQDNMEGRVAVIEKRFSEEQLATGKTLVALQKDVETANKALASIQAALMVRAAPIASTPTP